MRHELSLGLCKHEAVNACSAQQFVHQRVPVILGSADDVEECAP